MCLVLPRSGSAAVTSREKKSSGMKEDVTDGCQRNRKIYFGDKHLDFAEA